MSRVVKSPNVPDVIFVQSNPFLPAKCNFNPYLPPTSTNKFCLLLSRSLDFFILKNVGNAGRNDPGAIPWHGRDERPPGHAVHLWGVPPRARNKTEGMRAGYKTPFFNFFYPERI